MSEDNKTRTATDVLISLENKLEQLISAQRTNDLTFKILANKLGALIEKMDQISSVPSIQNTKPKASQFKIEAADTSRQMVVEATTEELVDKQPSGTRRVSRINGADDAPTPKTKLLPPENISGKIDFVDADIKDNKQTVASGSTPVYQRVLDKNNKAIFLADVEIFDKHGALVSKARTAANGIWNSALLPGDYRVIIKKSASMNRQKIEISQNVSVASGTSPQELEDIFVK